MLFLLTQSLSCITAFAPPLNVSAIQSSSSAPVEVSWSPPTDGANTGIITGYRIYYGNGQNVSIQAILSSSKFNDITLTFYLRVNTDYVGQTVSVRSEADQLYSELVNVSVSQGE